MIKEDQLIEQLAELEHDQWVEWSLELSEKEELSKERVDRWRMHCWKPYEDLSEPLKEFDRAWARKVISILKRNGVNLNGV